MAARLDAGSRLDRRDTLNVDGSHPELRHDFPRVRRRTSGPESLFAVMCVWRQQTVDAQTSAELAGNRNRGINHGHGGACYLLNERTQEGVVSASKHNGIGTILDKRPHVLLDQRPCARGRQISSFYLLDKTWAGLHENPHISGVTLNQSGEPLAGQRLRGCHHAHHTRSRLQPRRLHRWLDRDDRHIEA